jgi:hypothetical protein
MRKIIIASILFICFTLLQKNVLSQTVPPPGWPPIEELEKFVKQHQDGRATQTFAQYEELLTVLTDGKYTVLPLNEFRDSIDNSKVMVGIRHDVDCHPFKALKMAEMERDYGIRTSYYILATGGYYGQLKKGGIYLYECMDDIYKEISYYGHEIGIHNDLVVIMIQYEMDPLTFNKYELEHYKKLGIDIHGTVAHGSDLASKTVKNFEMFSDYCKNTNLEYGGKTYKIGQHSMKEFGFEYEANFINHTQYYSDSGGDWNLKGGFPELISKIKSSKPGDRIQILAHPVWWGK